MTTKQPYTPSEEQVANAYAGVRIQDPVPIAYREADDEFDRFIAQVRRAAAREALDGMAAEAREGIVNRETTWGQGHSIAYAAEAYRDARYPEETR